MDKEDLAKRLEAFAQELEERTEADWSLRRMDSEQYHALSIRVETYRDAARIVRLKERKHEDDRREARAMVR